MPINVVHLSKNKYEAAAIETLLLACNRLIAEALDSPIGRIRTIVNEVSPNYICVGESLASNSDQHAPFYEIYLLEGRPLSQQQAVLSGIAKLIQEHLKEDLKNVRGVCHLIDPERWAIGGKPAAEKRSDEIEARKSLI